MDNPTLFAEPGSWDPKEVDRLMKRDEQSKKFGHAARELGCDEDEAAFEERLRHLAKHKPVHKSKVKKDGEKPDE